jgi:hypothetical protein
MRRDADQHRPHLLAWAPVLLMPSVNVEIAEFSFTQILS